MQLLCGDKTLDLTHPCVMGVLNVTPDSFSDGGRYFDPGRAIEHAHRLVEQGAAIIDIGGESTRPGAPQVDTEDELRRVLPVIRAVAMKVSVPVSVDTFKPEVMRAAVEEGATLINDVRALQSPGALAAAASTRAGVCLMHMQGEPRTMQIEPRYVDVVREVRDFLKGRLEDCVRGGIRRERIAIDPGFGFGKALQHNLALLNGLRELTDLGVPVLAGLSRKAMLGTILGKPADQRLHGSLALAVIAVLKGARIIRAHDVAETVDAVKVAAAVLEGDSN
jgi:dihydropteroate synthase